MRPFCATRWTIRYESLHSVFENYNSLKNFFEEYSSSEESDAGAKASGFLNRMESFDFFFTFSVLLKIFRHVDATNTAIQKRSLHFGDARSLIESLSCTIRGLKQEFDDFWKTIGENIDTLGVNSPKIKRKRKISKKLDMSTDNSAESYINAEQKYRRLYYEIFDNVIACLETRFINDELSMFLMKAERFLLGDDLFKDDVIKFFDSDVDADRLVLHRDMLGDILRGRSLHFTSFEEVLDLLKTEEEIGRLLPELLKFIKLVLTLPVTTCTAERSFSCLRRVLTYLRSSMTQLRLNSLCILNVHREETANLNLVAIANNFISTNNMRSQKFAKF